MDKTGRNGLRVGDLLDNPKDPSGNFRTAYDDLVKKHKGLLGNFGASLEVDDKEFFEALEFLKELNIVNGEYFINKHIREGKKILAEGAQGSMLDIDFGTFPYVTSSNTISAGVCTGLGIAPNHIREVIGVTKAYCTRVGSGPFPTELNDATGEELRKIGNEFGATTGRPRRCGWIDLVALQFACMINGVTKIVMTKADVLDAFAELRVCTEYEIKGKKVKEIPFDLEREKPQPVYKNFSGWHTDTSKISTYSALPGTMKEYVGFINEYLGVTIQFISNGPGRDQIIEIK
jgi:adenylosuccinate synthase